MNDPVKYKRLVELASELSEKIDELNIGKLTREELESLTEHSRELYERLVVLRFKAYDNEVKESTSEEKSESPLPFRISESKPDPVNTNQVSLIDIIEEVTQSEQKQQTEEVPAPQTQEEPVAVAQASVPTKPMGKESLHDKLTRDIGVKESLAEKLESAPIQDLKKAITLNQRFQFSRELFKGNNQEYEMAIDKLNSISKEEAMRHIDSLKQKFTWNSESPVVSDFMDLVGRRHL